MRRVVSFVVIVITMIMAAGLVAAGTPKGVEPWVRAKVEAQLQAQGVNLPSKAGREVPVEVAKLLPTPDLIGSAAQFGRATSVDGDLMVVGAYDKDQGIDGGAAFIFQRNEGGADAWGQVARLTASDRTNGDNFGCSVSISGDTVVVGADGDDDGGEASGSAYIFGRNEGGSDAWGQVAKLTASDGATEDNFGLSVSISSDTVIVGAYGDDDNGSLSGSAYIFARNHGGGDAWGQVTKIMPLDGKGGDWFGIAVSINGDTVAVGACFDDANDSNSGTAYIFERNQGGNDAWGELAEISASDGESEDRFGFSVSISGDTVVVGAWGDDDNGSFSGSAYIFGRDQSGADSWGQITKILPSDGAMSDHFGNSVSISGDTVVVGALGDDDNGSHSGSAYIFGRTQGGIVAWCQVTRVAESEGAYFDEFGFSVAISGDTLVVGAHWDDDFGADSGSAYIFHRHHDGNDSWGLVAQQVAPGYIYAGGEEFGFSVSNSGDTVVVGTTRDSDNGGNSGSAYIFERNQGGAGAWGRVAKMIASDGAGEDYFGCSVSISGDTVIVGAYKDDDNGDNSGSVYIFGRHHGGDNAWGQVVKIIAPEWAQPGGFGRAVSISNDTVVVGSPYDSEIGPVAGAAYIFRRDFGGAGAWGQVTKLMPLDSNGGDYFGSAVSISHDTVVVGSPNDSNNGPLFGSAYVFGRYQDGTDIWTEIAKLTASDGGWHEYFGSAVSISDDTVVVGVPEDDDNGNLSGSVYVFGRDRGGNDAWGQVAKLLASDGESSDKFGQSVSIVADALAVGAYRDDSHGSAYLFVRDQDGADIWGQVAKISASDGADWDNFGLSVSINPYSVVVGAPESNELGTDAGSAYVFEFESVIFIDGFESGDVTWWSVANP